MSCRVNLSFVILLFWPLLLVKWQSHCFAVINEAYDNTAQSNELYLRERATPQSNHRAAFSMHPSSSQFNLPQNGISLQYLHNNHPVSKITRNIWQRLCEIIWQGVAINLEVVNSSWNHWSLSDDKWNILMIETWAQSPRLATRRYSTYI